MSEEALLYWETKNNDANNDTSIQTDTFIETDHSLIKSVQVTPPQTAGVSVVRTGVMMALFIRLHTLKGH